MNEVEELERIAAIQFSKGNTDLAMETLSLVDSIQKTAIKISKEDMSDQKDIFLDANQYAGIPEANLRIDGTQGIAYITIPSNISLTQISSKIESIINYLSHNGTMSYELAGADSGTQTVIKVKIT